MGRPGDLRPLVKVSDRPMETPETAPLAVSKLREGDVFQDADGDRYRVTGTHKDGDGVVIDYAAILDNGKDGFGGYHVFEDSSVTLPTE